MARKSPRGPVCQECGRRIRIDAIAQWIRWSDGALQGPFHSAHFRSGYEEVVDEDMQVVAVTFRAPIWEEYPTDLPIGFDPTGW